MNLLDFIPGGQVVGVIGDILDRVIPDKNEAQKAKEELAKADQAGDLQQILGQISVNIEEAKSSSVFVSGWRPWVGWVCGFAMAYAAIFEPMARFFATVVFSYVGAFPVIDTTLTMQVLLGMLGMGALRSMDKKNGVAA